MKNRLLFIGLLWLTIGSMPAAMGQGCSDPGICTVGSLNSESTKDSVSHVDYTEAGIEQLLKVAYTREKYRFEVTSVMAGGERDTDIYGLTLRAVFRLKDKMLFNVKVPYTYVTGSLGSAAGLGDITLSLQNTFYSGKSSRLSFTAGVVLPTGDANRSDDGFVLPMAYQTTLGSFNALVGLSGSYKNWGAAIGYQQSFGENGNQFVSEGLVTDPTQVGYDPLNASRMSYASSPNLQRGNDVILRLERRFEFNSKWSMIAGILPIQRLSKSRISIDGGEQIELDGTDGLTFNVTGGLRFSPSRNWLFRANFGAPIINRTLRADGLTRTYIGIFSASYRLW